MERIKVYFPVIKTEGFNIPEKKWTSPLRAYYV